MPFWATMIDERRSRLALHYLQEVAHYEVYAPRIRAARKGGDEPLFRGYCFVAATSRGWWTARWSPGIFGLIMNGDAPAVLADAIIDELRGREGRDGLIRLPKRKSLNGGSLFAPGDQVRVASGPMSGLSGLVQGMKPHARIEVLLMMLGALQRVELPVSAVARLA
jgi:transcription antitermination factor NusG